MQFSVNVKHRKGRGWGGVNVIWPKKIIVECRETLKKYFRIVESKGVDVEFLGK